MTISALRPLDAKHVSAVATAAAKAPFLRSPGGSFEWDLSPSEASPFSRGVTHHHGFELPEVAMDPMFEDVWEDTMNAVGPLVSSLDTQRKAMLHQCNHATKSFQDAIQKNIPHQMTWSGKDGKGAKQ